MKNQTLEQLDRELSAAPRGFEQLTAADLEKVCGGTGGFATIGEPEDSGSTWSQCHVDGVNDDDPDPNG